MPDLSTNLNDKIETLERKIFNYAYVKNKFDIVIFWRSYVLEKKKVLSNAFQTPYIHSMMVLI